MTPYDLADQNRSNPVNLEYHARLAWQHAHDTGHADPDAFVLEYLEHLTGTAPRNTLEEARRRWRPEEGPSVSRALSFARTLAEVVGAGCQFWLSCRDLGAAIGCTHVHAARILRLLVEGGMLVCTDRPSGPGLAYCYAIPGTDVTQYSDLKTQPQRGGGGTASPSENETPQEATTPTRPQEATPDPLDGIRPAWSLEERFRHVDRHCRREHAAGRMTQHEGRVHLARVLLRYWKLESDPRAQRRVLRLREKYSWADLRRGSLTLLSERGSDAMKWLEARIVDTADSSRDDAIELLGSQS